MEVSAVYQQLISEEIDRKFYFSAQILDRDYYSLFVYRSTFESIRRIDGAENYSWVDTRACYFAETSSTLSL